MNKKQASLDMNTIKVALVDDAPLAIEGWKRSLKNEIDIEVVLETSPKELFQRKKYPLPVDIILVGSWWLTTKAGKEWLRALKGLNIRPKVVAIVNASNEIQNAQRSGVDEAILSPVKKYELVNLLRGLTHDNKRLCDFYAKRLSEIPQTEGGNNAYEDLIYNVSQLLFYSDLVSPKFVDRDLGKRDLISLNMGSHRFWSEMKASYGVDYVIFLIDNTYVKRGQLEELTKYLDGPFGRFGIIFTRNGLRKTMNHAQLAIYQNYKKVILVIDDVHIREMLALKAARMDPLEILQDLYEDIIGSSIYRK
jgi:DNA-binding NarL/FixJ family response regulator